MALTLGDRVKETTTITGTGTATLLGATTGFQSFAVLGDGNTTYYCIADQGGPNWEVGIGTYASAGTTLARTTVLASSNAGALVTFTTGVKDIFVTYPSEKGVWYDASGNVLFTGTTTATNLAYTGTLTGSTGVLAIGTNQIYKDASGNVGIGVSSPVLKLDIYGIAGSRSVSTTSSGNIGAFGNDYLSLPSYRSTYLYQGDTATTGTTAGLSNVNLGTLTFQNGSGGLITTNGAAPLVFATLNTERMRIDPSGNVGIGTTTMAGKLTIQGAFTTNPTSLWSYGYIANAAVETRCGTIRNAFDTNASYSTYWTSVRGAAGSSYQARFGVAGGSGDVDVLTIDSSGRVLIGTTTGSGSNLLQVNSDALIKGLTVGSGLAGNNAVVGVQALLNNTTCASNSAVGTQALYATTSGSNNTSIGASTLRQNTIGVNNVAVGVNALAVLTTSVATLGTVSGGTGYTNGTYTGVQLTLSSGSPVVSVLGTYPIATIVVAGGVVTTVTMTSFGKCFQDTTTILTCPAASIGGTVTVAWSVPVASLSTGQYNMAVGTAALSALTVGSTNTAIGTNAGSSITTGSNNVVIGGYAGAAAPISATGSNYIVLSDGAGNIRTYYDASGNQVNYGLNATSAAAPTIASATTIAPTKAITFISGVTPIVTITAPSPISLGGGTITLIPTGIFTTTIADNIALASTAIVGRALTMTYDVTTAKWYPSY